MRGGNKQGRAGLPSRPNFPSPVSDRPVSVRTLPRLLPIALAAALLASGCTNMSREAQGTLSGAGIGAAGGVALTALTGGSLLAGGVVGGAVGAVAGNLKSKGYW